MKKLDALAATLLVVGGLNWGLVAIAEFDLVAWIFGEEFGTTNAVSRVVYGLVGVAAVYGIAALLRRGSATAARPATTMAVAALAAVALAVGGASATASTGAAAQEERDIVDTAVAAGSFDTLAKLLTRAGLVDALKEPGPYTVFAPTDAAFAKVPKHALNALKRNKAKLRRVLLYHVAAGRLEASDVVERSRIKTLNGKRVRIRVRDSKVYVNKARVTTPDVGASNGVIHVINRVLLPRG